MSSMDFDQAFKAAQAVIDTRAVEIATKALQKVEDHEQRTREHNLLLQQGQEDIKSSIRSLYGRWWISACGFIVALLIALGTLLMKFVV